MLKKILKWTLFIVLILLVGISVTVALRQNLKYDAPYPAISSSKDSSIIARGRYLVYGPAHCADCHAKPEFQDSVNMGKEVALSGGRAFNIPIGVIYSRNLTSDETGILKYTDQQIARSMRFGVGVDGRAMFDFMPFHNTSDEDLTAIISFLRTMKPVQNKVEDNKMNLLGKVIKAFLIKPIGPNGEVPKTVKRDTTAEYGKYLAHSVANCRGCHTNRDLKTGAFIGPEFAGGFKMESIIDPAHFSCVSPNLTPDHETGHITAWTRELFMKRFRSGKLIPHSTMPWGPFSRMSDDEINAIYSYLVTLQPIKNATGPTLVKNEN
jgi:mono/diheme cytochrome c family protein